MRSTGGLWPVITDLEHLRESMRLAARGKRGRAPVADFLARADEELVKLQEELVAGEYQPEPYTSFKIRDPKPRMIRCAAFRDRVVHHALCDACSPWMERRFIADSFACRKGKGMHAAVRRVQIFTRKFRYALHLDVKSFFESVEIGRSMELLGRLYRERKVLDLWETLLRHGWSGKDPERGLAIGNLSSQWMANLYLDGLDHQVKEGWRFKGYVRYMDDLLLFADEKDSLWWAERAIGEWLGEERGLRLKPEATVLGPVTEGVAFLGMRIFPGCLRFQAQRVRRMRKALALEPDEASVAAHMALLRVWGMPNLAKQQTIGYGR
jgi:RNA-directed DNA polymerase